ncbi:hypothetical protein [Agromyces humi]|uniref:hypothetical protein n=1 Tax=Agromyces humi TaxID=1766800 RepID=UPI00135A9CFF|nr:hypothetical protein [Agromyces humi]
MPPTAPTRRKDRALPGNGGQFASAESLRTQLAEITLAPPAAMPPLEAVQVIPAAIAGTPFGSRGFTVEVDVVFGAEWTGIVRDRDGRSVGDFTYEFEEDGNVHHANIYLARHAQQTGFAGEMHEALFDQYRMAGYTSVSLVAVEHGSYVWARAGFELNDDMPTMAGAARRGIAARIREIGEGRNDRARALLHHLAEDVSQSGSSTTVQELAALTVDGEHLGKRILTDIEWPGRLDLRTCAPAGRTPTAA